MADKQNDTDENENEYEFADLDVGGSDLLDDDDYVMTNETPVYEEVQPKNNIVRNVIIVLVTIVFIILFYKFFSAFSGKTPEKPKPAVQPTVPPVSQVVPTPTVVSPPVVTEPVVVKDDAEINQKLAALDATQQNLSAEVSTINSQLNSISANMNALNAKMASLNDTLTVLANKLEAQEAHFAAIMEARQKAQIAARPRTPRVYAPALTYYLQAIIPGRAWLIASNGSTITVREGTNIAGYGTVKMIDPSQGRVLLSSGRIIRFSQQDS